MPAPSGLVQQQNQFNQFFAGLRASLQTREEDIRLAKIQNLMNFLEQKEKARHDRAVEETKQQQAMVAQISAIVGGAVFGPSLSALGAKIAGTAATTTAGAATGAAVGSGFPGLGQTDSNLYDLFQFGERGFR